MRTLIFSDCHLKVPFEEKKYAFLEKIISDADQVILNGDFWDGYLLSFDKFVNSPWKKLFPLLKSRHAVYIYGNHDRKEFSDERVNLFSDHQAYQYSLDWNHQKIVVEHGHRFYPMIDERIPYRKINGILTNLVNTSLAEYIIDSFQLNKRQNLGLQKNLKKEVQDNTIYIFGHTHYPEDNLTNNCIISGAIYGGKASYITITDTEIVLKSERYD